VFPTVYADPPSTIDASVIVPAALTVILAVTLFPDPPLRGTLYNVVTMPDPYPEPSFAIETCRTLFKLWSNSL